VRNHDAEGQPVKIGLLQRHAIDNATFDAHPFKRAAIDRQDHRRGRRRPGRPVLRAPPGDAGQRRRVFEAREKSGGLNEYGIAKYKLTDDFAQREVDFLLSIGGIEIQHGQTLGDNLQLQDLHAKYDAVFLGLGLAPAASWA
jgi:dihydropyrimidine dehydrogenase (NAD+) subunit PreT